MQRVQPPSGTVTFLFTDIEGSTKLWEAHSAEMRVALARHDAIMRELIEAGNGYVFKTIGDAFCAAFSTAPEAAAAVLSLQLALTTEDWPAPTPIKVRMALHTGSVESRDNDYFGPPVNRVARLLSAGHGGQVLLSQASYELSRDSLPPLASLREMGDHRLKDLGRPESVYQLIHPQLPSEFAPLRSLDTLDMKHNLPQQVNSFVGREKEIVGVQAMLAKTRILTLTGAGGSGKTRLSLQVAADALELYEDGAWIVELAHIADPALVPQTVASVLGVKEEPGKPILQTLTDNLKSKQILLLLDNCEHVLDASARLADALIRQCPLVQILGTSREGLGISGEQTYRVPSLSLPDPASRQTPESVSQFEAVQLFIDRARLTRADFQVTNENAPALASICYRLDGIPLAIELAAARARSLSVEEIDGKLDQRFRLLTGGSRTALPRQQTLRALIEWSYVMLADLEREALEQLSVFVGGWTMEMAEQTCGDPIDEFDLLDLVAALVDKSLVNFESGDDGRYSKYETIRQFAREQLAARPESEAAVLERHAKTMAQYALERVRKFRSVDEPVALRQLVKNTPNVVAALAWSKANDRPDLAAPLALGLGATDQRRGYLRDGVALLDEVLGFEVDSLDREIHARLLCERATLALDLLAPDEAEPLAQRAKDLSAELKKLDITIRVENLLGQIAMARKEYGQARAHYSEAFRISEQAKNYVEMARLKNNLGIVERRDPDGDNELAAEHYRAALTIQRKHGHTRGEAETLNSLGVLEQSRGNLEEAATLYLAAARLETQLEHPFGVAKTLSNYGEVKSEMGEDANAMRALGIAEHLFSQIRSPYQEYTRTMLVEAAKRLGWSVIQVDDLRSMCGRIELKDAVSASLQ